MPDHTRAKCKHCRKHRSEVGPMSWQGYCGECGPMLSNQANDDLHYHQGPIFDLWRVGMAACVGAVIPDKP